jgi:hypothetical protein
MNMQANYGKKAVKFTEFIPRISEFCRNSLYQDIPFPLWVKTRHAFNFRDDDLARTHWKKIYRSLKAD